VVKGIECCGCSHKWEKPGGGVWVVGLRGVGWFGTNPIVCNKRGANSVKPGTDGDFGGHIVLDWDHVFFFNQNPRDF